MSLACEAEKIYLTTPWGYRSIYNEDPNGELFENRHSYLMSTTGVKGIIDWWVFTNMENIHNPPFSSNDTFLTERGIFQHGVSVAGLRAPSRDITMPCYIEGANRIEHLNRRIQVGGILSWDAGTAVLQGDETQIPPTAFYPPALSTLTLGRSDDQRFHIDYAIGWLDDSSAVDRDHATLDANLILRCPDPRWYGDEVVVPVAGSATDPVTETADFFIPPADGFITDEFFYTGTARGTWQLTLNGGAGSDGQIYAIGLYNVSTQRWARVRYIDYPNSGWQPFAAGDTLVNTVEFDFATGIFTSTASNGVTTLSNFDLQADPTSISDLTRFSLLPYSSYRVFIEASDNMAFTGNLTFRPYYAGI